jgi:hypothetical protein
LALRYVGFYGRDRIIVGFTHYLCTQWLSPLNSEFESRSWRGVLDITLCDKDCQWPEAGRWFLRVLRFQWNWSPLYNWNIVESGAKHQNHNQGVIIWYLDFNLPVQLIQCTGVNYHHFGYFIFLMFNYAFCWDKLLYLTIHDYIKHTIF